MQPSADSEDKCDLIICLALTNTQNRQNTVLIRNDSEDPYKLKKGCHIATFSTLTPEQAKYIKPVSPSPIRHLLYTNHDYVIQYVNAFLQMPKSEETIEWYWLTTPQGPGDEAQDTPIEKRILQNLLTLQKLEQVNRQSCEQFLSFFDSTSSILDMAAQSITC